MGAPTTDTVVPVRSSKMSRGPGGKLEQAAIAARIVNEANPLNARLMIIMIATSSLFEGPLRRASAQKPSPAHRRSNPTPFWVEPSVYLRVQRYLKGGNSYAT